jgi:ribosomal-protein-alanine N-acetyltransferase
MRPLRGELGLVLEPQIAGHAAELYAVLRDPQLYTYIDTKEPASEAALRERLERLESRRSPDGTQHWLNWVVRNAEGAVIGYVQATVHRDASAEIAYVLGRDHWRQGYGAAAVSAMVDELVAAFGVRELRATLDPLNAGSRGLLRKFGFTLLAEDTDANEVTYRRPA